MIHLYTACGVSLNPGGNYPRRPHLIRSLPRPNDENDNIDTFNITARATTNTNLGVLSSLGREDTEREAYFRVDVADLKQNMDGSGPDGGAITGSVVLGMLILYFSFERVFGIDKMISRALRDWIEKREGETREIQRDKINALRQNLIATFEDTDEDQDPSSV